jgi:hypothetical protein
MSASECVSLLPIYQNFLARKCYPSSRNQPSGGFFEGPINNVEIKGGTINHTLGHHTNLTIQVNRALCLLVWLMHAYSHPQQHRVKNNMTPPSDAHIHRYVETRIFLPADNLKYMLFFSLYCRHHQHQYQITVSPRRLRKIFTTINSLPWLYTRQAQVIVKSNTSKLNNIYT